MSGTEMECDFYGKISFSFVLNEISSPNVLSIASETCQSRVRNESRIKVSNIWPSSRPSGERNEWKRNSAGFHSGWITLYDSKYSIGMRFVRDPSQKDWKRNIIFQNSHWVDTARLPPLSSILMLLRVQIKNAIKLFLKSFQETHKLCQKSR